MTVQDIINKNEADIVVMLNGHNPEDDCDPYSETYYKGNNIQIRTTADKYKYNICLNENKNKLEKKVIGQKKFTKQNRSISSSLDITKNIYIKDWENP